VPAAMGARHSARAAELAASLLASTAISATSGVRDERLQTAFAKIRTTA
jgi:hypothetical protein